MPPGHGPQAPRTLGRYELVVEVAKGQLGPLWLAHVGSELFGIRRVKTAAPIEPGEVDRLSAAARWSLDLQHDNVARVVDVVTTEGELGVVAKYVPGEPLRSLLRLSSFKRKPVPAPIAMRIGLDVLKGLAAVHERAGSGGAGEGIGSGGVNPDAVLVGATTGQALLLDVGIGSVASAVPSLAQHPELGAYAAPEQVDDPRAADPRSDVFSLGVLLWEMISSRRLFAGASESVIREKLSACAVPRLDATPPVGGEPIAADIADVVARALARDPAERYQDAAAMSEAIKALGTDAIAEPAAVAAMVDELAGQAIKTRAKLSSRAVAGKKVPMPGPRPQQATLVGIAPEDPLIVAPPRARAPSVPEPSAPEPRQKLPSAPEPRKKLPSAPGPRAKQASAPEPSAPEPSAREREPSFPEPEVTLSEPEPSTVQLMASVLASSVPPSSSEPEPTTLRRASATDEPTAEAGAISEREIVDALTRESNPGPPPLDSIDFTTHPSEARVPAAPAPAPKAESPLKLPKLTAPAADAAPAATAVAKPEPIRPPQPSDALFAPPSQEQIERTQKARKVVAAVVAGLAGLLVVGLAVSALRSGNDAAPAAVREATEPARPTPAVPAPDPSPAEPAAPDPGPTATAAAPSAKSDPAPEPAESAAPPPVEQRPKTTAAPKPRSEARTSSKATTTSKPVSTPKSASTPKPASKPESTSKPAAKKPKAKPKYVPSGI